MPNFLDANVKNKYCQGPYAQNYIYGLKYVISDPLRKITYDIKNHFSIFHGEDVKVYYYGSQIFGLSNENSALDIFVDVNNCYRNSNSSSKCQDLFVKYHKSFENSEKVTDWIYDRKTILEEFDSSFPRIRSFNRSAQIMCHISFADGFAVENSKFIKYLYSLQPEALKLAKVIIAWSDSKVADLISPYALNVLTIFLLQTLGYLPSTKRIQSFNDEHVDIIGGWDVAFDNTIPLSIFNLPIMPDYKQFIPQFFSYYAQFEFSANVICAFYGKPVSRECFSKFSKRIMVVIGPFNLTQNLTKSSNELLKFREICMESSFQN